MPTKLYVGNVPHSINARELKELFEKYGKVLECDIVKDYAFVHMEDASKAKASIAALNEFNLKGNRIRVEISTTQLRNRSSHRDDSPRRESSSNSSRSSRKKSENSSSGVGPDRFHRNARENHFERRSNPYERSRFARNADYPETHRYRSSHVDSYARSSYLDSRAAPMDFHDNHSRGDSTRRYASPTPPPVSSSRKGSGRDRSPIRSSSSRRSSRKSPSSPKLSNSSRSRR